MVIAVGAVTAGVLAGCAEGSGRMPTAGQAQRSALQLLRETEQQIDLDWPDMPSPSAEACKGGVRFGYYVPVKSQTNAKALAKKLQRFWKSKGLDVSPSETDFGGNDGILYSATAEKSGAAGAAYQLSDAAVVIRITSPCAEGSADDYEE
ncbi:hypothetical protein ACIPJ2_07795 [Curtobacterium sp. NPDC090217]|uniref:hypothetical protein n=1 Tax=Curtobacterium sp. NPDC090217 TaxID=3363970 RepID=UPI00382707A0